MPKFKIRYKIGDWVKFSHIVKPMYKEDSKTNTKKVLKSYKLDNPAIGQIVGMAIKYEGEYAFPVYNPIYQSEQPYLKNMKGTWLWLVRTGLANKPYLVRNGNISLTKNVTDTLPFINQTKLKGKTQ